ncbi:putative adenylyl-sulfate kinase [Paenibacillus allorhizoplanae]|uniref:Adenylyl-sulfate kinase n=1 Tax=Paenibacillus allorhizoplanae TaxID=2905648 RepID=A0ABN8H8P8_9BACL|nr:adenylyl-sulfate kinase [Paenibacillus allorhizoplanae]CAH1231521.1 putative adenylyl-sulfate kinase [Paenibacillus allorhizoplanae]
MNNNLPQVFWHQPKLTINNRRILNQHKSCVIWLTGLSASGKSTLANELDKYLYNQSIRSYVLDGDNVRHGLNKDLGFSPEDRKENIRRICEVAQLFVDAGLITIAAFISPYLEDRKTVRAMFPLGEFIEVYVKCSVEECERRDPKGLYKMARTNQLKEFTGISAPYEISENPELTIETDKQSVESSILQLAEYLKTHGYLQSI